MKKKNLLIMCTGRDDATSFWRGAGPMSHLYKTISYDKWDMQLCRSKEIGWGDLINFDVLFFQRPHSAAHIKVIQMAKNLGVKVWVDYDDDLMTIPFSNAAHKYYADPEAKKNLSWIAANADHVSVSTESLRQKYQSLNKNVTVVQNAWDDVIAPNRPVNPATSKIIFWRGSASHDEDIDFYLPQMARAAEKYPDWKWVFVGQPFWKVANVIKSHAIVDPFDVPAFLKFLPQLAPSVAIVPLAPNVFNQSKSNIAWQEATFAGACSVVPEWTEWKRPGTLNYCQAKSDSFFFNILTAIEMTPHERKKLSDQSWQHIATAESLKFENKKRADILEALTA
jgi:hypothetical protein